jgi:drug/metabolite transporter (DMT)-like permease
VTATAQRAEDTPFAPLDWGFVLGAASIWGGSFLFMAIGLDSFEPGVVTLLRVVFGLLALSVLPGSRAPVPKEDLPKIALLGVTWMAFPLTMFPIAQQWIDSSVAGMLNAAMPLLTVLIAWSVFQTPTGPRRLFGVGVGLVGILLISVPEASTAGTNALGVGLVVLAVASYGIAVNIAGPLQQRHGSLPVISRALAVATVLTLPYGIVGLPDSTFAWDSLIACILVGAGGTGVAFLFAANLSGRVGAVRASLVTYVIPIISIGLGVVFRDETVTIAAIVGTGIVLFGAYLSSRVN